MPPHLSCPVGAEAPCAAEQTATSSSFPRPTSSHAHRCSQHGGEQSGLVTLTFDLLTLKVMSESHVTWATYMPILVFLDLFSTKARSTRQTDVRRRTDRRQTAPSLNAPLIRGESITTTVRLRHLALRSKPTISAALFTTVYSNNNINYISYHIRHCRQTQSKGICNRRF